MKAYRRHNSEISPFRMFLKMIKARVKDSISKDKGCKSISDISLENLMELWKEQKGICPLTGWELILPINTTGWTEGPDIHNASIDRIDSNVGYVKGNVRYISFMANICKQSFTDSDVRVFCAAVTENSTIR